MVLVLLLLACSPSKIPDHLKLDAPAASADTIAFDDLPGAIDAILGRDPLARTPRPVDPSRVAAVEGGEPVADALRAFDQIEAGGSWSQLPQVEERWRGTAAVGLARGYRLGQVQRRLATDDAEPDPETDGALLLLVTPLQPAPTQGALPGALHWLGPSPREALLTYGDRWVLEGWLDGPGVPLQPVAERLKGETYDALRETPAGKLVMARAGAAAGPAGPGLADLRRATTLALVHVAADRDTEQAAWAKRRDEAAAELGAADPVVFLLGRATDRLIAGAASDRAAGGALLAMSASRWYGACDAPPCGALDRVDTMTAAGRWDPEIAHLSRLWRVIALKSALDTMDVGNATAMYPRAIVDLADALLGTGAGPIDASVIRKRKPDGAVWLSLGRAVGAENTLDWPTTRAALGKTLAAEAVGAAALEDDPEIRALLERLEKRTR